MKILNFRVNDGVIFMLIASFCFAVMGVCVKLLSSSIGVLEITFLRNIIGTVLMAVTLVMARPKGPGGRVGLLIFRAVIGCLAMLAWFYNIAHISLAEAMTFSRTAPIFTAIIAYFALKERIGARGWAAVMVGFAGVVLIMQPAGFALKVTDWVGLFSGLGAAMAYTSVRELKRYYDTRVIVFWFMFVSSLIPLALIVADIAGAKSIGGFFGTVSMPRGIDWLYIVMMGVFATTAQIFMTRAYGAAKAGIAAAVSYADIVFAVIFGLILWGSVPNALAFSGIILVVLGGILVAKEKS